MPATPQIQAALEELKRRGIDLGNGAEPVAQNLPAAPGRVNPAEAQATLPADRTQKGAPADATIDYAQVPPHLGGGDNPSAIAVERNLRIKQMQGQLAVQDAVNELKRRGVNLQLKTAPATEEIVTRSSDEALENARKQGDPEAFKNAWRQFFPGKALPRKPDGTIDYEGGQDDIDVELDRLKKLQLAKAGSTNIKEVKTVRMDPVTGKETEVLVRVNTLTGEKLGETVLSESHKAPSKEAADSQKFATLMTESRQVLDELEKKKFNPAALGTTAQGVLPNRFRSEDVQKYEAAKQNWVMAHLRDTSGATITTPEFKKALVTFFPKDGDSPSVVEQKKRLRLAAEDDLRRIGGRTATPGATPSPTGGATTATATTEAVQPDAPVDVKSAAEAPPTAKFIRSPSGRVYRNPKYKGS